MKIDLQLFCSADETRPAITKPWSRESFTFATNGHIIIRVPRRNDIPEDKAAPDAVNRLPWGDPLPPHGFAIPSLPEDQFTACKKCDGTGKDFICPECEGTGIVQWETERHDYEADCAECDGSGRIKDGKKEGTCEKCDGAGKVREIISVEIGGVLFDKDYLALIKILPDAILFPVQHGGAFHMPPSRFTFAGGDGMIMPRRI